MQGSAFGSNEEIVPGICWQLNKLYFNRLLEKYLDMTYEIMLAYEREQEDYRDRLVQGVADELGNR